LYRKIEKKKKNNKVSHNYQCLFFIIYYVLVNYKHCRYCGNRDKHYIVQR